MTKEGYLSMCEQLGNEPLAEEIPMDLDDFPYQVQIAMQIYQILPDRWEGFSGTYLGKEYSIIPFLFDTFEVECRKDTLYYINVINNIIIDMRAKEQQRKAKQNSRKGKKGIHV